MHSCYPKYNYVHNNIFYFSNDRQNTRPNYDIVFTSFTSQEYSVHYAVCAVIMLQKFLQNSAGKNNTERKHAVT